MDDLRLLRMTHHVTDYYQPRRVFNPVLLIRQVWKHDVVFCWFAGWHSLAPTMSARVLGKPSVVVIGGYDTANLPEADYGSQRGGLPRLVSRMIIQNATRLVANSYSARREAMKNAGARPDKISVIYHGVEPCDLTPPDKRQCMVLTVGGVWKENLLRKGLLPFIQAARLLPEVRFVHAGKTYDSSIESLKAEAGPNVELRGFVSDAELGALYAQASVYVQASLHEGFGLSVAEAMSAGCIPVVTRVGALPEVVGDCGVYADSTNPEELANAIQIGLGAPEEMRLRARQRVLDCFRLDERATKLYEVIQVASHRKRRRWGA
jgi:glycosyltransferase involved in cell wall biosynthesis